MKTNLACSNRAGRWFGTGYMMNPKSHYWRLAGTLPAVLLWLAVLPLAVFGQTNYATPFTFTTLAGQALLAGSADGTNSAARFNGPSFVAVDTNGNVYVADAGNNTIRKVTPVGTNWVVTTLAGVAGSAGSANGTGPAARFNGPYGVAVDSAGNVYVADSGNDTIRKATPVGTNWVVTTLAGLAGHPGSADGMNSTARFNNPGTVTVDLNGNLYVADCNNYTIRKMTPVGTNWVVTTLAGLAGIPGSADGTNGVARFNYPWGLALDSAGNIYLGDANNDTIRKVTPVGTNWVVTTLAGLAGSPGCADGTNSAARFFVVGGGAVDSAGNVYVVDYYNATIREVSPVGTNWVVTTVAGMPGWDGSTDGTGSDASFNNPNGIVMDNAGNLYVPDFNNNTIRKGLPASTTPPATSAPPVTVYNFLPGTYTNSMGILPYRLFIPTNYNPALKYPLVLYLHGSAERGSENLAQLLGPTSPLVFAQEANQNQNPSFMVAPQCPNSGSWTDSARRAQVLGMINALMAEFSIDPDRVYITGHSMGAYGTWDYITQYPQMYAAAVPMSGGGNTSLAGLITHMPIWNFHAADDPNVSVSESRSMVSAVRQAGGSVIYTEYAIGEHVICTPAYNTPILMDWVYSQKRGTFSSAPPLLSITNPTGQQIYILDGPNLNLSGSATDGTNGVTGVTWTDYSVGVSSGAAQGTTNWSATNILANTSLTNNLVLVTASGSSWYSPYGGATTFNGALWVMIPNVQIAANPTNGVVPLAVQFSGPGVDSDGNTIIAWNWNFGDGITSALQNPAHIYATVGNFSPGLVVTNNLGLAITASGPSIGIMLPTLQYIAAPTNGLPLLSVQFTSPGMDSGGNTIMAWNWNFGDGATSTLQNPMHVYSSAGTFYPSLIATNNLGYTVIGSGPVINAAYLVVNGGFETGDFIGWTMSGDTTYTVVDNGSHSGITPHSGNYEAALGTTSSLGYLSQTLATTPGAGYLLSCWFDNPFGDPGEFIVSWNGKILLDETNPVANAWTNLQFVVSATGTNTVLQFGFFDNADNWLGLDDISVVAVLRPGIASVSLSGTNLVVNGFNGLPAVTYCLVMSTNLALPLSQWTPVATNVLNAGGNFTITATNAVDPNALQRFYRLMLLP